jgi:glycosyltransferase involved in cell wall biosynthesis
VNILMFSEASYPRHPGGAGKCSHLLAAGLVARGHTVRILCQSNEETVREIIDGVEVHRVRFDLPKSVSKHDREAATAQLILTYLDETIPLTSVDVIHDSGGFLSYFFPVTYQLLKRYTPSFVLHFRYLITKHHASTSPGQNYDPFSSPVIGLETMINETTQAFPVRMADVVVCPSTEDAEFVRQVYRPACGKPVVIPDPVDMRLYSKPAGLAFREEFARPGEQLVLFGGRIDSKQKGSDIVLKAFKRMLKVRSNLRLLLLAFPSRTTETFVKQFGDAVRVLGWIREADKLANIFGAVDLIWMPSRYEPFGMMCAEALAAGTPVVASPVGGLRDMVLQGENGFLFNSPEPEYWDQELAGRSLEILSNPTLAKKIGEYAAIYAKENLSIEKVAERIEQVYNSSSRKPDRRKSVIQPPVLTGQDRQHYLALLGEKIGPEARYAGQEFIKHWQDSIEQRCLKCTRQRMGHETRRLLALRSPGLRKLWTRLLRVADRETRQAVEAACPLGLLQKNYFRKGQI